MTKQRKAHYLDAMKNCKWEGTETGHWEADNLLIEFLKETGFPELAEEFKKLPKWYA